MDSDKSEKNNRDLQNDDAFSYDVSGYGEREGDYIQIKRHSPKQIDYKVTEEQVRSMVCINDINISNYLINLI